MPDDGRTMPATRRTGAPDCGVRRMGARLGQGTRRADLRRSSWGTTMTARTLDAHGHRRTRRDHDALLRHGADAERRRRIGGDLRPGRRAVLGVIPRRPVAGNDNATDVAKTSTATGSSGQVDNGATDLDASRAHRDGRRGVTVQFWNSPANSNDANNAVAARGSYAYIAGPRATRATTSTSSSSAGRSPRAPSRGEAGAGAAKMDDEAPDVVIDGTGSDRLGTTENSAGSRLGVRKYTPAATSCGPGPTTGPPSTTKPRARWWSTAPTTSTSPAPPCVNSKAYAYTVKLSPTGAKLWTRRSQARNDVGNATGMRAVRRRGYVAATQRLRRPRRHVPRALHRRWRSQGLRAHQRRLRRHIAAVMYDLAVASNGTIYGVGLQDGVDPAWVAWSSGGDVYTYHDRLHGR